MGPVRGLAGWPYGRYYMPIGGSEILSTGLQSPMARIAGIRLRPKALGIIKQKSIDIHLIFL